MTSKVQNFELFQGFAQPVTVNLLEQQTSGTEEPYTTGDFTNWRGMMVIADDGNTPVVVITTTTAPASLATKFTSIATTGLTLDDTNSRATFTISASQATLPIGVKYRWGLYLYNAAGAGQVFLQGAVTVKQHPGH